MWSSKNVKDNYGCKKYVCDSEQDLQKIPAQAAKAGSQAYVIESGMTYILDHQHQWAEMAAGGFGSSYELPIATADTLGGIKASDSIAVDAETGVASAVLTDNVFATDEEVTNALNEIFTTE